MRKGLGQQPYTRLLVLLVLPVGSQAQVQFPRESHNLPSTKSGSRMVPGPGVQGNATVRTFHNDIQAYNPKPWGSPEMAGGSDMSSACPVDCPLDLSLRSCWALSGKSQTAGLN